MSFDGPHVFMRQRILNSNNKNGLVLLRPFLLIEDRSLKRHPLADPVQGTLHID